MQVNNIFLIIKYYENLISTSGQDENQNIFPLAFAIVEGEIKEVEVVIWFFQLLREYITPQPNVCLITKREIIIFALQSLEDGKEMGCPQFIASDILQNLKTLS